MSSTTLGQDADLSLRRMYQQVQVHARTLGLRETPENLTILRPIRQLLEVAIGSIEDKYEPSAPHGPIVRIGGEDDGRPLPASPPTPDLGDRIGARPGQTTIVGDTPGLSPPDLGSGRPNSTSTARNQRAGNGIRVLVIGAVEAGLQSVRTLTVQSGLGRKHRRWLRERKSELKS
jgi:hypothetical protein